MKRFLLLAHGLPAEGLRLDDLPGSGRADLVCRTIAAALLTSHAVRDDTEVVVCGPRAVRFQGQHLRDLRPDERSIAGLLHKALQVPAPDPWWHPVSPGIDVAPFTWQEVLGEADSPPVWLDRDGQALAAVRLPDAPTFLLSDHKPFSAGEAEAMHAAGALRVSLGRVWYHADHAIHIIQHHLDALQG
jgi:tRNA (pseudouridine54-N1)-methyltransferase